MTRNVLVIGPPLAGKSTWVREHAQTGDLIWDFDLVHAALSLQESHQHLDTLKPYVFAARDAIFEQLRKPGVDNAWIISSAAEKSRVQEQVTQLDAQVMPLLITQDEAHKRADKAQRPADCHGYIDNWFAKNDWTATDFPSFQEPNRTQTLRIERLPVGAKMRAKQNDGIERRDMALDVALRLDGPSGAPIVEGYAAVFDSLSEVIFEWDNGRFREKVAPGAFAKTLREQNIPLLVEHAQLPLATTGSGTLTLREDGHGLHFISELEPTDPDVQRLVPKMRRGDLNRCSFGFIPVRQAWDDKAKPRLRTILEAKLIDVSIVARPAYPATEAKVRKALADDGLDAEMIVELLVRLRQGLPLDEEDTLLMRRLAETCQRHLPDTTTAGDDAPNQVHPSEPQQPVTLATEPNVTVHPLAWYRDRLSQLGA